MSKMQSFQNEIPSARINIRLDVDRGSGKENIELPLKVLILGEFTTPDSDVSELSMDNRDKILINNKNIDVVMKSLDLRLKASVKNHLSEVFVKDVDCDLGIDLNFSSLKDFYPSRVLQQIPDLQSLMGARNLVRDFGANILANRNLRRQFEQILENDISRQNLNSYINSKICYDDFEENNQIEMTLDSNLSLDLNFVSDKVCLSDYVKEEFLAEQDFDLRMSIGLKLFLDIYEKAEVNMEKLDRSVFDTMASFIDLQMSEQINEIMHNQEFKKLESSWYSLKHLLSSLKPQCNIKLELFNCSKQELIEDFEDSPELTLSTLYKMVYIDEYDTPGGEPYGALIGNYEFSSSAEDINLLSNISKISAAAHSPFLGAVSSRFFSKNSMAEVNAIDDIESYMERAEFSKWRTFRNSEDARYVGLILPKFLLRLPYNDDSNPVKEFSFNEKISMDMSDNSSSDFSEENHYLWGNSAFAFAGNMIKSFIENGWCVQIRGPQSGGKVDDLPLHFYDVGKGIQQRIPTEILIPETREFDFSNQGFISLSSYKNKNYACFFSAASAKRVQIMDTPQATSNCRINSQLPYMFLTSRLAHYLKVQQRENIGAAKSASVLSQELNSWIKNLVTEMKNPGPELIATHPLSFAEIIVDEYEDWPGFYKVSMTVVPHFQVEGVDVSLSLISKMPQNKQ